MSASARGTAKVKRGLGMQVRMRAFPLLVVMLTLVAGCTSPSSAPTPSTPASSTPVSTSPSAVTPTPTTTPSGSPTVTPTPTLPPCASATATGCTPVGDGNPGGSASGAVPYAGPYSANGPGSPMDCAGTGPIAFARAPMNESDYRSILPYGIVVGGHVTPIDHMYFTPFAGEKADAAPVLAIADGNITDIQTRPGAQGISALQYRVWIVHTCTFFSYFDLATSLAPAISQAWNASFRSDGTRAPLHIPVKAGDYLARVGGETLDFGVYDDQSVLPGLLVPEHYVRESWKIHTVDPLPHFPPDVQAEILAKDVRHAEPRLGKIDDDVDGTLAGTWFVVGTNGYAGVNGSATYWATHASFIPDTLVPAHLLVSLGNFSGEARQFGVQGNAPAFVNVTQASGPVAFTLASWSYHNTTTGVNYAQDPPAGADFTWLNELGSHGVVLVQLRGTRSLELEAFPNATAGTTPSFDAGATFYER